MNKQKFIQAAVLNYVTEAEKIKLRVNYLLENTFNKKEIVGVRSLFENAEDVNLYSTIVVEGILDKIKNFFSNQTPTLTPDEKSSIEHLRQKVEDGLKQIGAISKVSIEDPTKFGMALEKMVEIAKEAQEASDRFTAEFEKADVDTQNDLQSVYPQLMQAKTSLLGMVAFKLSEIRKEVTSALESLVSFVPSGLLSHALSAAKSKYTPELPLKSGLDTAGEFMDFSGGTTRTPGGVGM